MPASRLVSVMAATAAAGVLACALGWPQAAGGYVVESPRRPGRAITYYNEARQHDWAVRQAVRAWNRSGARVEFVPAAQDEAELVIAYLPGAPFFGGLTSLIDPSSVPLAQLEPQAGDAETLLPRFPPARARRERFAVALVAAHELGHVVGLGHYDAKCAIMNSEIVGEAPSACAQPGPGEWRCRLVERDDAQGAVRIYGGRPRRVRRSPFCPKYPPPRAPSELVATRAGSSPRTVTLRWRTPRGGATSLVVARTRGSCPRRIGRAGARTVRAKPGRVQSVTWRSPPVEWCYAVWSLDRFGRPSRTAATATLRPPAPPGPPTGLTLVTRWSLPILGAGVLLRWRNADDPALRRVAIEAWDRCPPSRSERPRRTRLLAAGPGRLQRHLELTPIRSRPPARCYLVRSIDDLGIRGGASTVAAVGRTAQGDVLLGD